MEPEFTLSEGALADLEFITLGEVALSLSEGATAAIELVELGTIEMELSLP
jgi:hypothetical protein